MAEDLPSILPDASSDSESDSVVDATPTVAKKGKKKAGRKATWKSEEVEELVHTIAESEYYKKMLIFRNIKNAKNGEVYGKVLTDINKVRSDEGATAFSFNIEQVRNKFKKCVGICKHVSMTIKTASGIERIRADKEYGAWFDILYPLVTTRDSCNPELAAEPSDGANMVNNSSQISTNDSTEGDNCDGDNRSEPQVADIESPPSSSGRKQPGVPLQSSRKRSVTGKEMLSQAVSLLEAVVKNDPTQQFMECLRDEGEKSRRHDREMLELIVSANRTSGAATSPAQPTGTPYHPFSMYTPQQIYSGSSVPSPWPPGAFQSDPFSQFSGSPSSSAAELLMSGSSVSGVQTSTSSSSASSATGNQRSHSRPVSSLSSVGDRQPLTDFSWTNLMNRSK